MTQAAERAARSVARVHHRAVDARQAVPGAGGLAEGRSTVALGAGLPTPPKLPSVKKSKTSLTREQGDEVRLTPGTLVRN